MRQVSQSLLMPLIYYTKDDKKPNSCFLVYTFDEKSAINGFISFVEVQVVVNGFHETQTP